MQLVVLKGKIRKYLFTLLDHFIKITEHPKKLVPSNSQEGELTSKSSEWRSQNYHVRL